MPYDRVNNMKSCFNLSIGPEVMLSNDNKKTVRKFGVFRKVLSCDHAPCMRAMHVSSRESSFPLELDMLIMCAYVHVLVCIRVCVCARVFVCMGACGNRSST